MLTCLSPLPGRGLEDPVRACGYQISRRRVDGEAAVLGAMQVERGLGEVPAPGRRLLSCPFLRAEPVGVELPPVVAQGSLEMGRIADALLDLGQILGSVIAGRPVRPDPVDER